jgi:hypothetical protein
MPVMLTAGTGTGDILSTTESNTFGAKKKAFGSDREFNLNNNLTSKISAKDDKKFEGTEYSFSEEYHDVNDDSKKKKAPPSAINPISIKLSDNKPSDLQGLDFNNLHRADFNDEFTELYEEFSPSWRKECDRLNLKKKDQKYELK